MRLTDPPDREALNGEARRRRRRRRAAFALVLLALAGLATWRFATGERNGGTAASPTLPRPAVTLRLHLAGFGTPLPAQIDQGPCPQGRTLIAIRSATGTRIGWLHECGLTISRTETPTAGLERIAGTALDSYALPGGTIAAREWYTISFAHDQRHTLAIFRGRISGGSGRYAHAHGTLAGGGGGLDGRADWRVELNLAP